MLDKVSGVQAVASSRTVELSWLEATSSAFSATGGTVTTDGDYTIHTFTSSGTLACSGSVLADVLVVGGGGSGGARVGGGGGAGGVIIDTLTLSGSMSVVVGDGGAAAVSTGSTAVRGNSGGDSSIGSFTAYGGGGGGAYNGASDATTGSGYAGGSGGGAAGYVTDGIGGAGEAGQGYDGGDSAADGGAGGGGAGEAGANAPAGAGGDGVSSAITGTATYYGGGGGGCANYNDGGAGGLGGGGTGKGYPPGGGDTVAESGDANTGGGGGGVRNLTDSGTHTSGAGGSGVVVVRYSTQSTTPASVYRVTMSESADMSDSSVLTDACADLTYTATGLTNATTYYFTIEAGDGSSWGDPSDVVSATPVPDKARFMRTSGSGLQVVIAPVGRAPYIAPLRKPPQFSAVEFGGYSAATITQGRVSGALAARLLFATVTIWGRQGPCWRGVVKETQRDGTLYCVGLNEVLAHTQMPWTPGNTATLSTKLGKSMTTHYPSWMSASDAYWTEPSVTLAAAIQPPVTDIVTYYNTVMPYLDWQYGWYFERINGVWDCVAHYGPPSTTPDYFVTLSAEDTAAFMGDSLENMSSKVGTTWSGGLSTTTDTDASHYLVQIEREWYTTIQSLNTASADDADLRAAAKLKSKAKTKAGRTAANKAYKAAQVAGVGRRALMSMTLGYAHGGVSTTSRIQLASGLDAYLPSIRPGALARLIGLPSGPVDLRISGVECNGDATCTLDLGADSGRLESLLARVV